MSLLPSEEKELCLLLAALREGYLSDSQRQQLNDWIVANPRVRRAFIDYMKMCGQMHAFQLTAGFERSQSQAGREENLDLWQALAEDERMAPTLAVKEKAQPVLVQNVRDRKLMLKANPRKTPLSVWISMTAMAAMLLIIAIISLKTPRYEVATITDSMDLRWSSSLSLQKGTRLQISSEPIELRRGIIKIETDKGVRVVIEAPAEFRFINPDEIVLDCGRLSANVSEGGSGFTVRTGNSKIIDLGTEFGVYADFRGQTELHMFKGKAAVIAGQGLHPKQIIEVSQGRAVRMDDIGRTIENIPLQTATFARDISSRREHVWRHDGYIDLADIIGGGNGTGNGAPNRAIAWDGQTLAFASEMEPSNQTPQPYVPVSFNPFIDGIFIPQCKGLPLQLSSEVSQLRLDEFLKQDTNGVVTLMVVKQDSDSSCSYWFCSKEGAAGDVAKMPLLYFPRGANGQPAYVTTADGRGADTCVIHDGHNQSNPSIGQASSLQCRYLEGQRVRIIYLRFDISGMQGELSNAVLNLYLHTGNRQRKLEIYGLRDGLADFWDEESLDYSTAPALKPVPLGRYEFDDSLCVRLGSLDVIDNRAADRQIEIDFGGQYTWTAPETIGNTHYPITNADRFRDPVSQAFRSPLRLGSEVCGTAENPSILMHANAGITFDLEAVRKEFGSLDSFTASCGIARSPGAEKDNPSAAVYVLLDGQEMFAAVDITPQDDAMPVEISLPGRSRFLTLIATQGTDGSIDNDLCVFLKPRINLAQKP